MLQHENQEIEKPLFERADVRPVHEAISSVPPVCYRQSINDATSNLASRDDTAILEQIERTLRHDQRLLQSLARYPPGPDALDGIRSIRVT
jgi:hypothetical protein